MIRRRLAAYAAALTATALLAVTGCSLDSPKDDGKAPGAAGADTAGADGGGGDAFVAPYDVRPLLKPAKKYFGVAVAKAPHNPEAVSAYATMVGKQPNLLEYYAEWGDGFDASGVREAWQHGAMTLMSWEPLHTNLGDIAAGKSDAYLKKYAKSVRALNLPIVIDFADEFNGHWETWGTNDITPAQFVAAWRHIHDLFVDAGAGNVIWAWTPNIINPVRKIQLKPYYPGDGYVDWVGIVGYFTVDQPNAFDKLFGPTMNEIRAFTQKPFLIAETSSEPGQRRRADVKNLFDGVAARKDVLGFVWFNVRKRADWRLEASPLARDEFRQLATDDLFGFDVRKP